MIASQKTILGDIHKERGHSCEHAWTEFPDAVRGNDGEGAGRIAMPHVHRGNARMGQAFGKHMHPTTTD